jgi:hypothetical protein
LTAPATEARAYLAHTASKHSTSDKLALSPAWKAPGGSSIGLIDAKTNEWIQNIPAPPNAHSVVISQANAHILVPSGKTGGFCGGCILVFGEK